MDYYELANRFVEYKIHKKEIPKINYNFIREQTKKYSNDMRDFELDSKERYIDEFIPVIKMRYSNFKIIRKLSRK